MRRALQRLRLSPTGLHRRDMQSLRWLALLSVAGAASALRGAGLLTPRPPLAARASRPHAVLEHAAAFLDHAPALFDSLPWLHDGSLLEHGPTALLGGEEQVAEMLKDGTIVVVPESQALLDEKTGASELLETQTEALNTIGRDLVIFLAASVFVTPVSQLLGITPVLGFLLTGAIIGPCAPPPPASTSIHLQHWHRHQHQHPPTTTSASSRRPRPSQLRPRPLCKHRGGRGARRLWHRRSAGCKRPPPPPRGRTAPRQPAWAGSGCRGPVKLARRLPLPPSQVFLLFAEGLNLSVDKLRSLSAYFPLGGDHPLSHPISLFEA